MLRIGNILKGIFVIHVGDDLHAEKRDENENIMDQILKTFEIKDDTRKEGNFSFLGRQVAQQPDGIVFATMQTYLDDVKPIFITKTRRPTSDATGPKIRSRCLWCNSQQSSATFQRRHGD